MGIEQRRLFDRSRAAESALVDFSRDHRVMGRHSGVQALSCVLRAGRTGASTDHCAVMFNVDTKTGIIGEGLPTMQVDLRKALGCRWTAPLSFTSHPDNNRAYVGVHIPDFEQKLKPYIEAHEKLCPEVPVAGWDLALTKEAGPRLLAANLSCNFFKGSFDQQWYFDFIRQYFVYCEQKEKAM